MNWLRGLLHPALQVVEVYVPLLLPGAFGRRGTEAGSLSQEALLFQQCLCYLTLRLHTRQLLVRGRMLQLSRCSG